MTSPRPSASGWSTRRRLLVVGLVALAWSIGRAGVGQVVNTPGAGAFGRFWAGAFRPELAGDFLALTADAAATTAAYAVLGTALSLVLGAVGALATSELLWDRSRARRLVTAVAVLPRATHEIVWALVLVRVFGFDPWVAVLAIGIPFGAVTAKVLAETIDEADPRPYRALRALGAGRLAALAHGVLPAVRGEMVAYAAYRLECAVRSAAVLGVIGAGGLGFQLDLSFESLRYDEIWTLIAALMLLSGVVEAWSRRLARRPGRLDRWLVVIALPVAAWWIGLDPTVWWSERTRRLASETAGALWPPRLGPGGWSELVTASVDTLALSILATTIAVVGALAAVAVAAEPPLGDTPTARARRVVARIVLLLARAVPAPVWAFVAVLVLFPGIWPGAVALGLYNLGVVGRLFVDAVDERDRRPARALATAGATGVQTLAYATLPTAAPRLTALALYRWEVVLRETVVVGVVGAGGLGRLLMEHLAARDLAAVTGVIGSLVVLSLLVDAASASLRRALR